MKAVKINPIRERVLQPALLVVACLCYESGWTQTADGNNGLNQANTLIRSYFDTGTQLMYGVCALLALIGAGRVYALWGEHNSQAQKAAAGWFGSCIFLVIVSTVIRSFFGL